MTEKPPVSVVVPAYNAAWCIDKALESVLEQSYSPLEIIVVNDGSSDDTSNRVKGFGERVRLVEQPNGGLSSARNTGIRQARGEWVAFLDADDCWLPGKLQRQMELLASRPDLGFCSTCTRVETPEGEVLNLWHCPEVRESALRTIFARNAAVAGSGSAVVARRDLLLNSGGFDEQLHSLEDIDMWLRLAAVTGYGCVDEPLTVILKRPDSMSRNLDVMRQSALRVMHKNRALLDRNSRGSYWQAAYASVLADYAKWEYRVGHKAPAMLHLLEGLVRAPLQRGRLILGLLVAMALGQKI